MNREERIKIIERTSLFKSLNYSDFVQIAEVAKEHVYAKDEIVFKENSPADAFYIIAAGKVSVYKLNDSGKQEFLASKSSGEVFGEMALIDDLPRSATIKAIEETTMLIISKAVFVELLHDYAHIGVEIARNIAYTVRKTNSNYISDLEKSNEELKLAYKKLKDTQSELIRVEKLSVIGKFASLIIHDIKNPMSNIRAYAELIQMSGDDKEKIFKSTSIIIDEIDRLTKMTGELLDFSRGEMHLTMTPLNLTGLLATQIDIIKEDLSNRKIKIVFKCESDIIVIADSEKLIRVFKNLVNNSADALLTGGTIVLKLQEGERWVRWTIQDNGIGMEDEVLKNIFEPFYSHNKKKGTGLGMPIVKSIIDSHKGTIKVYSKKDHGTRFDIYLPRT